MKKILLALVAFVFLVTPLVSEAYVNVKGYFKANGTYVEPYVRSNPNGLKYDNYGYKPSQGLYNNSYGTKSSTWDTPTWTTDPDYYLGKSLYDSGSSYTPSYTPSYVPTYTPTYAPSYFPTYGSSYYGYGLGKNIINAKDKAPKVKKMKISEVAFSYAEDDDCKNDNLIKKDQTKCQQYVKFKDNNKYSWIVSDSDKKSYATCGEYIYSIFKLEKTEKFVCKNGVAGVETL